MEIFERNNCATSLALSLRLYRTRACVVEKYRDERGSDVMRETTRERMRVVSRILIYIFFIHTYTHTHTRTHARGNVKDSLVSSLMQSTERINRLTDSRKRDILDETFRTRIHGLA